MTRFIKIISNSSKSTVSKKNLIEILVLYHEVVEKKDLTFSTVFVDDFEQAFTYTV